MLLLHARPHWLLSLSSSRQLPLLLLSQLSYPWQLFLLLIRQHLLLLPIPADIPLCTVLLLLSYPHMLHPSMPLQPYAQPPIWSQPTHCLFSLPVPLPLR